MKKFSLDNKSKIETGFKAPDFYFDHLSLEIFDKIDSETKLESKVFSLKNWLYVAAAILILAVGIPYIYTNSQPTFEDIDTSTLENYIAYQSNITSFDLINSLDINELDKLQIDINVDDIILEDILIANPNLENYIIE